MDKIGIIGAMAVEVETLKAALSNQKSMTSAKMTFLSGTLEGADVVVVHSGIGKVNAALCAHILIKEFACTKLIFTGIAGSLDPSVNILDIVISTGCVHYDVDCSYLNYDLGEIPQLGTKAFTADPYLVRLARYAVKKVAPTGAVFEGCIASGDRFVHSAQDKDFIRRNFSALCCEMEGAAVAQTCYLHDVPFVIIRAISDKADGSAELDYKTFEEKAAKLCSSVVKEMVSTIARTC